MTIEINEKGHALSYTGSSVDIFRMKVLLSGLMLEIKTGMRLSRRGTTCYARIKKEYNLKGSKQKVYDAFKEIVDNAISKEDIVLRSTKTTG